MQDHNAKNAPKPAQTALEKKFALAVNKDSICLPAHAENSVLLEPSPLMESAFLAATGAKNAKAVLKAV